MEKLIGLLILALIYAAKAVFEARAAAQKGKQQALREESVPQEEVSIEEIIRTASKRKKKRRKQPREEEYVLELEEEPAVRRGTLSRELNPLGEGTRIEAAPGTLNTVQFAAPRMEPSVKPELESLTGIYGTAADNAAQKIQVFDMRKILTQPDGIRQGIIWAEVLKRPEW